MLKSISPTINTDGGIELDVRVKAESPETLTIAQGLSPLGWRQEIRRIRSSYFLVLMMARKAVIDGDPDGDWYIVHAMERLGYLREENAERRILRCTSSRYRSGVKFVTPKSKASRASLAVLPVVDASAECRRSRE